MRSFPIYVSPHTAITDTRVGISLHPLAPPVRATQKPVPNHRRLETSNALPQSEVQGESTQTLQHKPPVKERPLFTLIAAFNRSEARVPIQIETTFDDATAEVWKLAPKVLQEIEMKRKSNLENGQLIEGSFITFKYQWAHRYQEYKSQLIISDL